MPRLAVPCLLLVVLAAPPALAAGPPREVPLKRGWEQRIEAALPGAPQPAPPEETVPDGARRSGYVTRPGRAAQEDGEWHATRVPSVFDTRALPQLFPGEVRRYRLRFEGPTTPAGFRWLLRFDGVRRAATVVLNGRRLGRHSDAYTPFEIEAKGLRPGRDNELEVIVDNRKNPQLPEAWWNWGGIVRPVSLVPAGPARLHDIGTMSDVACRGPATRCRASLLVHAELERRGRPGPIALEVALRAPGGRRIERTFTLPDRRRRRERLQLELPVPAPQLWSPDRPQLYAATLRLRAAGRVVQVERRAVGLRSVTVKGGHLRVNNRRVELRGASIHEDMPGSGAALTAADMDRIVADLKDLGANVTRAHYLMSEGLLERFDRAGIMVWNQAPIWQRDVGAFLSRPGEIDRALRTVRRTVTEARSHPSVLTHSVANEMSFTPDDKPDTKRFLLAAQAQTREIDPTLPVSVDIKGRPGYGEQFTYGSFDMLGVNQYFGWYEWVADFNLLEPFIYELRDHYPGVALVMTEWGAEARPELASSPATLKGSYAFQTEHARRTLDVIDRSPVLDGAIYWTLREFEINPGWRGGAGRRPPQFEPNTRHHKGLIGYGGDRKPVFGLVSERFRATPLYP